MVAVRLKGEYNVESVEQKILNIVQTTLDDNKAEDIVVIDLKGKTSIAGYMVIASGNSQRHVASIAEKVFENLKKAGYKSSMEGEEKADWVLIDAFDVIVHIFKPEVRDFYNIEKMWQSAANLRK
ncbi:MAG: ribosome silencing factor [Alphaproteobacteria bacterium]|nr:ribosome silencing factor [Alphaproteobacteria bacterium]